jgi:hypothetical protein
VTRDDPRPFLSLRVSEWLTLYVCGVAGSAIGRVLADLIKEAAK